MRDLENTSLKPIVFWEGFPVCGFLLKKVIEEYTDIVIVATRPSVPFQGLEDQLGKKIHWLDNPSDIWLLKDQFSDRNFIVHTGWNHNGWIQFDRYLKRKNNASVVVVVDNRFKLNLRQLFGALYFRIRLRKYFDAAFVPGRDGFRLMQFLGMPRNRIYLGNYGAYEGLYYDRIPFSLRRNEFLYVGQLNYRKGIDVLTAAFKHYRSKGGTWTLRVLGDGPMRDCCIGDGILFEGFTQPHLVAAAMNRAKVFVLVSRDDHWGTVVCEAAACGANLITTRTVGASVDIVRNGINGIELSKLDCNELSETFTYYEQLDNDLLKNGSDVSKGIAKGYDSFAYYTSFNRMVHEIRLSR